MPPESRRPGGIPLPIEPLLPAIAEHLRRESCLVIEAPPGAGKTTRVPPALLSSVPGDVIVLEPRRLAARLAARRVAAEMGERVGETAGYQVRFEEAAGPRTRLRFVTEGVLTRRLLADPNLAGAGTVILDEFHERHLDGDLALALLRRLQRTTRPDLRLVVMSATLETAPVAAYLGGCAVLRAEGRLFETAVRYTPSSAEPLESLVAQAVQSLVREGLDGDVLVFLPGAAEIRRAGRALEALATRHGLLVLPLHGDLSPEEQDRAVQPAPRRKVILSTNVAESSVTIEGVTAVVDSGLARVAGQSLWSGLPSLRIARISRASATQRAGRAGRTGPGRVVRLYPAEDFHRRPEREVPEILRSELSGTALHLRAMGIQLWDEVEWLDAPSPPQIESADRLLELLGAIDGARRITETGRGMAHYPLHPRLARLVIEAGRRGVGEDGRALAALLSAGERLPAGAAHSGPSDLLVLLESQWERGTRLVFEQLRRLGPGARQNGHNDEALLMAVLAAFPDRVARRRQGDELLLASGGSAVLARGSVVRSAEFLVAVEIEDRQERGLPLVRLASAIEPDWLLDQFPGRLTERAGAEWNRVAERVDGVSSLLYDSLVIAETRGGAPDPGAAARLLAERAIEAGVERFAEIEELKQFLARAAFAAEHSDLPVLTEEDVRSALRRLCAGLRSFADLADAAGHGGLVRALAERLPAGGAKRLEMLAPEKVRLPGGRNARVNYAPQQPPWIASRIQDFFGMRETPRVAGGKVPVVVRLLAPNQRPVQTTQDLAGFWERLYPEVRRQLSRRYPKHFWPEDPLAPGAVRGP